MRGEFVEETGQIRSCDHCDHYKKDSVTNVIMKDRAYNLNLQEICVSICVIVTHLSLLITFVCLHIYLCVCPLHILEEKEVDVPGEM